MTSFNTLIQYMCQTLVFIYSSIASLKQFFNQKYRKFYSANMTLFTLKANLILLKYKENSLQSGLSFIIHLLSNVHNLLKVACFEYINLPVYFCHFFKDLFLQFFKITPPPSITDGGWDGSSEYHWVKSVRIWKFSGLYFPAFGLNT